jgi:2-amino-4-hydroxy-6-hydroxymethyldihydropteridine diphosphokinase
MIALGLGSNVGDRKDYINRAIEALSKEISSIKVSGIYKTKAWGDENQADFLNACMIAETDKSPEDLLDIIKQIESDLGRTKTHHWGPREIDIDILLYDDKKLSSQRLTIPHPQLADRAFVLVPLAKIAPDLIEPNSGKTIAELAAQHSNAGVRLFIS